MSDDRNDAFYIGYQARAHSAVSRFLRPRVVALFVLALLVGTLLVLAQGRFASAFFEFGNERNFAGIVSEFPYPTLLVERPGNTADVPYSRYLLVVFGKHGANDVLTGMHGDRVELSGQLIYRDDQTMIEIRPDSIRKISGNNPIAAAQRVGDYTLQGEIIDSKCHLGVMKPGSLKPHRACAIRCISGGIPPIFVVQDIAGNSGYFLLTGSNGQAVNKEILDMIAEPLEISGEVLRGGSELILRAEPEAFRRLAHN